MLPELDAQTSQSDALNFWRNGGDVGSPCSWAGTFVEVVQQLPPGAISAEGDGQLAATGSESGLLSIAALTMVAGGAMLMLASRRGYASH